MLLRLAFVLAVASAVDVLNPMLRNSPYENLRELEAASAEPLSDLDVAESVDVRHSVRSFFRQQTKRPPPGPTPAAVLLQNLKNEDIDLAEAERIVENRKRAVSGHKRAAEVPTPNAVQVGHNDDGIPKSTTPGPFTPGFTDDAFYTSEPTSVPYTFESFPKIDLDQIRTTPITTTSEEGGGEEDVEVDTPEHEDEAEVTTTTEAVEVVYPSAEVFTEEPLLPSFGQTLDNRNQSKGNDAAVVIQPTLSTGPLATFEDINAFLFHPPTSGPGEEEPAASLSAQLEELEEQLIRESGETELLRETPKRKRKVGDPTGETNAVRSQLPLPALAPPISYQAPPRPDSPQRPEMEYVTVEEDDPLNGGGDDVGESFLVVSKDDVALSQRVKEATHGWDDLDDDIITAIERVLAIDIPVDSKLLYRNPSPRVTRKSPKFPGSDNEIDETAKVKPIRSDHHEISNLTFAQNAIVIVLREIARPTDRPTDGGRSRAMGGSERALMPSCFISTFPA